MFKVKPIENIRNFAIARGDRFRQRGSIYCLSGVPTASLHAKHIIKDRVHFLTQSSAEIEIRTLESPHSHRNTASMVVSEGIGLVENDSDRFRMDSGPYFAQNR